MKPIDHLSKMRDVGFFFAISGWNPEWRAHAMLLDFFSMHLSYRLLSILSFQLGNIATISKPRCGVITTPISGLRRFFISDTDILKPIALPHVRNVLLSIKKFKTLLMRITSLSVKEVSVGLYQYCETYIRLSLSSYGDEGLF
jgi:hypothetical protein